MNRILSIVIALLTFTAGTTNAAPPQVGDKIPALELENLAGEKISLQGLLKTNHVALVFLRGWNGYQCPLCTKQVAGFVKQASDFADRNYSIVFIYPGHDDADTTTEHATDFCKKHKFPANVHFLTDPGVTTGKDFDLFWDAKKETVYPSLYLIAKDGTIKFSKVSQSHGNRVSAADALKELE